MPNHGSAIAWGGGTINHRNANKIAKTLAQQPPTVETASALCTLERVWNRFDRLTDRNRRCGRCGSTGGKRV
jgi:hypothetical protein